MIDVVWDLDDDPEGNVSHIAEHDVSKEEVEYVLNSPDAVANSGSSGRPVYFGFTEDGRYIAVVFEWVDDDRVYPVTAYEIS
jgi:hypothetical protein